MTALARYDQNVRSGPIVVTRDKMLGSLHFTDWIYTYP